MVPIDSAQDIPVSRQAETAHTGGIVLFALVASALLATAAVVTAQGSGWSMAAPMVSRFSVLLFVAAMVVEPLARLIPVRAMRLLGRERGSLTIVFAAASALSLACLAAPSLLGGERMPMAATAYCVMTAMVLVVMLFSGHPAAARNFGAAAWRALHRISTSYFWAVFMIAGIEHLVGPHLPDRWYGFSLLLLVGALMLRFANSF